MLKRPQITFFQDPNSELLGQAIHNEAQSIQYISENRPEGLAFPVNAQSLYQKLHSQAVSLSPQYFLAAES